MGGTEHLSVLREERTDKEGDEWKTEKVVIE